MPFIHIILICSITILSAQKHTNYIGAISDNVISTPLSKGTKFVSPHGEGTLCSKQKPCSLFTAADLLVSGDVVFLRKGTYLLDKRLNIHKTHNGTQENPIIIESYPGEIAILDGNQNIETIRKNKTNIFIMIWANHIQLRKLEIKNMSKNGIMLGGSYNIVEGCEIHNNHLNGIAIYDTEKSYKTPYIHGFNQIKNNIIYENSDLGLFSNNYANGNNADGISILSGKHNKILHNTVYKNSDDGIDTGRSNNTEVAFNLVYKNGSKFGDGNGIKSGGILNSKEQNGLKSYVHHNISALNNTHGFNANAGRKVTIVYNTSYMNGKSGYAYTSEDMNVSYNIEFQNKFPIRINKNHMHNSWQTKKKITFINTDIKSEYFLTLKDNLELSNLGAHSNIINKQQGQE
jgi:parallel beta-helix repeat protein